MKEIKLPNDNWVLVTDEVADAYVEKINTARKMRITLRALLRRCPGVYTTDQKTGETFDVLINKVLSGK